MKIFSWNVNGIRAAEKKGFLNFLKEESPDIIGIQEIKAKEEQLSKELKNPDGYYAYFNSAVRPGYSGVAIYSKTEPINIKYGFGIEKFDIEGRVISAEYKNFIFINIYFPNGRMNNERLKYKMEFYDEILKYSNELVKKGKKIIVSGDYNTAHKAIDLSRPKENEKVSGFLPEEREWIDTFISNGYIDSFREFSKAPEEYSWWSMRTAARLRNVGWRLDYHFISENLKENLKKAYIRQDIIGSDHCPVVIELDF